MNQSGRIVLAPTVVGLHRLAASPGDRAADFGEYYRCPTRGEEAGVTAKLRLTQPTIYRSGSRGAREI